MLTAHEWTVRDGSRVLRFYGWLLAQGSSERAYVERWSEIEIYKLLSGEYLIARVGRSVVAHRPDCPRVNHRMQAWVDARPEERDVRRAACLECRPSLLEMDPQTRLETSRYSAQMLASAEDVVGVLSSRSRARSTPVDPSRLSRLAQDVLTTAAAADEDISKALAT